MKRLIIFLLCLCAGVWLAPSSIQFRQVETVDCKVTGYVTDGHRRFHVSPTHHLGICRVEPVDESGRPVR